MKFVKLPDSPLLDKPHPIWVNPENIAMIALQHGKTCFWFTADSMPIPTHLSPEELIQLLTNQD